MTHPVIHQQVTLLYTRDLLATAHFYEDLLGLELALSKYNIYHFFLCDPEVTLSRSSVFSIHPGRGWNLQRGH